MTKLSRASIVQAAIELLDREGESGLTFRALQTKLETGPGALYWHLKNKDELLAAATDDVVGWVLSEVDLAAAPADAIRTVALGLFDAIDAHPWIGSQLSQGPWRPATLQVFERIGAQLGALGVPEKKQFMVASTLVGFVLGIASQNAANARSARRSRESVLAAAAASWAELDAKEFPFVRRMAKQLRDHDDRAEFLAGIDLILAGITPATEKRRR